MNWISAERTSDIMFHQNGGCANLNAPFQGPVDFFPSDFHRPPNCQYFDEKHSQEASIVQQKKIDQDFINNFILNLQHSKKSESKEQSLKIFEARSLLLEIITEKNKLENDARNLSVNDENFNSKWEDLVKQMNKINDKILMFNPHATASLKTAISKRIKKRKANKKRRMKFKALKELEQKEIEEKHKIIDKLLSERSDEVELVKREAALKRQADTVLHEVRKKKYEAKKMLNLLSALAKLRELRSTKEEEQGGYCSKQLTETFNGVMNRFQKLWEKQIEVYKLEEKGLKIMLEENALPYVKESKFETNLLEWEKVLFGDVSNDQNEKLLTIADDNIQALIQVRRDWDQFIAQESTAMASSIPPGWVLPQESKNEEWKAFTKISKKVTL